MDTVTRDSGATSRGETQTLTTLLARVESYSPRSDLDLIRRAYEFADIAHSGQNRKSGEPFITHPLATAHLLASLHLDAAAISAALLHDVPEDTDVTLEEVRQEFGEEVAQMVDGVTKLGQKLDRIQLQPLEDGRRRDDNAAAETVRKMFLAMAEDIRIILIKLADRLHNMQTLGHLDPAKRRVIATETMEIYAPLAARLGIWQLKWQLEDMAFRHLEPAVYKEIAGLLASRRTEREQYIAQVVEMLRDELAKAGLKADVVGRPKHISSIYRKMQRRGVDFKQIYDLLAVRVLVDEVADCYHALGIIHSLWHPMPGQFDDYIAMPKESMYQSLHTTVLGPGTRPLEIQIRTHQMHRLAEYGVAAHWRYKEGAKRDNKFEEKIAWLRQLIEWQKDVTGAQEFVDSLKTDIFQDQVYVFTPKGEIKELPSGATPLDFAYRIHTDIGHRCVGAKVNGRLVPLDYQLSTGEIVEIITTKASKGPSRDWLNSSLGYVKTANAREKIRQWFKRQQRDENITRGRDQLDKELSRLGVSGINLEDLAKQFKYDRVDEFYLAVGCGDVSQHAIASKLVEKEEAQKPPVLPTSSSRPALPPSGIQVMGVGDLLTRLARCCHPVPGDEIVGFITRGHGVTIHRAGCPSVMAHEERERLVAVEWGRVREQSYPVDIRIEAFDRDGLLRDVATVVAEDKINMTAVSAVTNSDHTATITATIEVTGIDKLSRVLAKLEAIKNVYVVTREVSRK